MPGRQQILGNLVPAPVLVLVPVDTARLGLSRIHAVCPPQFQPSSPLSPSSDQSVHVVGICPSVARSPYVTDRACMAPSTSRSSQRTATPDAIMLSHSSRY